MESLSKTFEEGEYRIEISADVSDLTDPIIKAEVYRADKDAAHVEIHPLALSATGAGPLGKTLNFVLSHLNYAEVPVGLISAIMGHVEDAARTVLGKAEPGAEAIVSKIGRKGRGGRKG